MLADPLHRPCALLARRDAPVRRRDEIATEREERGEAAPVKSVTAGRRP